MKPMTVGDLIDALAVPVGASREAWRALEITVRGQDEDGNDFCGALTSATINVAHDDDQTPYLALDASNGPI